MAEAGAFLEQFRDDERETLAPLRFGVCVGRFYEDLAQRLLKGAGEGFEIAGVAGRVGHRGFGSRRLRAALRGQGLRRARL